MSPADAWLQAVTSRPLNEGEASVAAEAEQGGVALAPFRKAPGFSKTPGTALIIPCSLIIP